MRRNLSWICIGIAAMCSCDKPQGRQPSTKASSTTEESEVMDRRPKAPLALERTIHLLDYPLQIHVPEQWVIEYGTVNILQGPTPHGRLPDGRIHLIVSKQGPLTSLVLESLKATTRPTTGPSIEREEMRALGKMKVYERRSVQPATAGVPAMMRWTIAIYEPIDKENVRLYQISFLDLSREHFEKDRELLESIVKSIDVAEPSGESIK